MRFLHTVLRFNTTWLSDIPWKWLPFSDQTARSSGGRRKENVLSADSNRAENLTFIFRFRIWGLQGAPPKISDVLLLQNLELRVMVTFKCIVQQSLTPYKKIDSPCAKSVESKDKAAIINVVVVVMGRSEYGLGSWPLGRPEWKHERRGSFPLIGINCYHGH